MTLPLVPLSSCPVSGSHCHLSIQMRPVSPYPYSASLALSQVCCPVLCLTVCLLMCLLSVFPTVPCSFSCNLSVPHPLSHPLLPICCRPNPVCQCAPPFSVASLHTCPLFPSHLSVPCNCRYAPLSLPVPSLSPFTLLVFAHVVSISSPVP